MMKKLFALLLAAVMLLGAGATALAAEPAGYDVRATDSSRTNSLTVGVFAGEGLKNGRLELTYPEGLTLVSARGTLDAGAGITDLDASKPGTVHFAWAAYAAQKDAQLLQLTFRGQHGKSYELTLTETETGKQAKFQLAFDFRFADVMDENAWYYDAVYAAYDAGLMNGVGEGLFAPNATLDRATLATVLYREAGEPAAKGTASFTDIAEGQWYTDAVNWAAEQGVVNGYPDGTFRPEAPITRQEMATMLYRLAKAEKVEEDKLASFPDAASVADWAKDAMNWAVSTEIVNGSTHDDKVNYLDPTATALRCQAAAVACRYLALSK